MWEYIGAFGVVEGDAKAVQDLLAARPGGIIQIKEPGVFQHWRSERPTEDCKGCGAPLNTYIHHCEYCRRAAC